MQKKLIKANQIGNVPLALGNLPAAEKILFEGKNSKVISDVNMKHKIPLSD